MDLADDYMSPFNFEQGVNTCYLYLSPTVSLTQPESPGSPLRETHETEAGSGSSPPGVDVIFEAPRPPELGEDAISTVATCASTIGLEDQEELHSQLAKLPTELYQAFGVHNYLVQCVLGESKNVDSLVVPKDRVEQHRTSVEDEIQALCQVLASKEKRVAEIKRKLGISPLNELKQNITRNWREVTTSTAYKKTSESLSHAGERATAVFSSVGLAVSRTLGDVRNTATFKSFEEKVEYLKTKMSLTTSTGPDLQDQDATRGPPGGEQPE